MQMSKCHICDMKYKNWNSHFFRFHPQYDVKTEDASEKYKLKPCFVKMDQLIKSKKTIQVIHANSPEDFHKIYFLEKYGKKNC